MLSPRCFLTATGSRQEQGVVCSQKVCREKSDLGVTWLQDKSAKFSYFSELRISDCKVKKGITSSACM